MNGSKSTNERVNLLSICSKIIFNSEWSKNRFLTNLDDIYTKSSKLIVIKQSAEKQKVSLNEKQKIITFVGKLNKAKGYDVFGSAILDVLNRYKDWKGIVIGDEEREKLIFNHDRLNVLGFKITLMLSKFLKNKYLSCLFKMGRTIWKNKSRVCELWLCSNNH